MKQETLEEVAQWVINNRYAKSELEKVSDFEMYNTIIDKCSKWQQEQDKNKYSEEDLEKAFKVGFTLGYGSDVEGIDDKDECFNRWFKIFKDNQDENN